MKHGFYAAFAALLVAFAVPGRSAAATCTIDQSLTRQVMRGFGGASVWHGQLTTAECDALFTTLGLGILRVRIDPDGQWTDEIANAKNAQARGAIVMASPWSPPAYMKDNASTVGGSLLPQHYDEYADWLNNFASFIPGLYAVSVQNEPNINVSYESCSWTESQLFDFVVNHAGRITNRLIMPETFNFVPSFCDSILSNPTGASNTAICAYHWYGANRNQLWSQAYNLGKDIWMTEHYDNDQTLDGALATAVEIHKQLTVNFANAYVWWYLRQPGCNLIEPGGSPIHIRGYVMAQWARFVRFGAVRVDASGGANTVYTTAFVNSGKLVVVAVNTGTKAVSQSFTIKNGNAATLSSYTTSATKSLSAGPTYNVNSGTFSVTLDAKSVTTFVQN
jgi:glucuronoarabinoxylan endo-1,4-beta-xylanase